MKKVENYHGNFINTKFPLLVLMVSVTGSYTGKHNHFVYCTACMVSPSMAHFSLAVYKHTRFPGRSLLQNATTVMKAKVEIGKKGEFCLVMNVLSPHHK